MKNTISIYAILLFCSNLYAQHYVRDVSADFNIQIVNYKDTSKVALKYDFMDSDGDGDYDLYLMGLDEQDTNYYALVSQLRYFLEYQENTGGIQSPKFKDREHKFPNYQFPTGKGFMIPTTGDINGDGLTDFIVSSEVDLYDIQYLQFQIQKPGGQFELSNCLDWELDPFPAFSFFIPHLTDLDMDGDLDILLGGYFRTFDSLGEPADKPKYLYAKNTGSRTNPVFLGWFENPYGLVASTQSFFTSGDVDLDGDMDLINLELNEDGESNLYYIENIGGKGNKPKFAKPVQSGIGLPGFVENETFLFPSLVDIDTDGDVDLYIPVQLEEDFQLRFYRNNLCNPQFSSLNKTLCPGDTFYFQNTFYTETGIYNAKEILPNGCIKNTTLNINVLKAPDLNIQKIGTLLSVPFSPDHTYRWLDCDTDTYIDTAKSNVLIAPYTGHFGVEMRDANGCLYFSDCLEVIISGVENTDQSQLLKILPNPGNGIFLIKNKMKYPVTAIKLNSLNGRTYDVKYNKNNTIDLSAIGEGLYIIQFRVNGQWVSRKLVIAK